MVEDTKAPVVETLSSGASGFFKTPDGKTIEIRDVWASNLDEEMTLIRELIEQKNPYVAMVRNLGLLRNRLSRPL